LKGGLEWEYKEHQKRLLEKKPSKRRNLNPIKVVLEAFKKAIEVDPEYSPGQYNKDTALEALGRTTEADAAFSKAKELGYKG